MKINLNRVGKEVGISIRAMNPRTERWGTHDVAELDKESLLEWLDGMDKAGVINTVGVLLGHGHLIKP